MLTLLVQAAIILFTVYIVGIVVKKCFPPLVGFMNKHKKTSVYSMFSIMLLALIVLITIRLNSERDSRKIKELAEEVYKKTKVGDHTNNIYTITKKQQQMEQISRELKEPSVLGDSSKMKELLNNFKNLQDEE